MPDEIIDDHDLRVNRVRDAINADPSGFTPTLLCAAFAEYYLKQMIASVMKGRPEKFFRDSADAYIGFIMLVRLAEATGVVDSFNADLLKALARLRNKFAHDIDHILCKEDLARFRRVFYKRIDGMSGFTKKDRERAKWHLEEIPIGEHLKLFLDGIIDYLDETNAQLADPARVTTLKARNPDFFERLRTSSNLEDLQL